MTDRPNYRTGADGRDIALEARETAEDARMSSPSVARNKAVIRDAFLAVMPTAGRVLEIGSGTGEHAVEIAGAAPHLRWTPSDPDPASRASIAAWRAASGLPNLEPPRMIDVALEDWPVEGPFDAMVSINMIHIAPYEACKGLLAGAGRLLASGGKLFLYGPFQRDGAHTAPSNAAFDESLKSRDPRWGVRDLDREVAPEAQTQGLALSQVIAMPANNLVAIFEKPA